MIAERPFRRAALLAGLAFAGMSGTLVLMHQRDPTASAQPLPGLTFAEGLGSFGNTQQQWAMIVTSVQSNSVAESAGIKVGDVIDQVNGQTIVSAKDVAQAVSTHASPKISVRIKRDGDVVERDLPAPDHAATSGNP